jgi:hypothetical protein
MYCPPNDLNQLTETSAELLCYVPENYLMKQKLDKCYIHNYYVVIIICQLLCLSLQFVNDMYAFLTPPPERVGLFMIILGKVRKLSTLLLS